MLRGSPERECARRRSGVAGPGCGHAVRGLGSGVDRSAALVRSRTQIDLESQDAVLQRRRGVGEHGEILEVQLGRLDEEKSLGSLDRRETSTLHRFGTILETLDHLVGFKGLAHDLMLLVRAKG